MRELIINSVENKKIIALIEDGELVEKYEDYNDNKSIEGNIYVGKVQNIITGLQSAFINIGEKRNAFIHAKDLMPKVDITKEIVQEESINKLIKPGDPIIVEVKKESVDHKGPRVSTHINLSGRGIVFLPNATFITVSQKIEDPVKREKLKEIVKSVLPDGTGAIVRTVAENMSEEDLKNDVLNIIKRWDEIKKQSIEKFPQKIYNKGGILKKTIVDLIDTNLDRIIVNNEDCRKEIEQILLEIDGKVKIEIKENPLDLYSINKQIEISENRKVWLKCGGFITIDKTEALTAIDVNSGKFIGNKDLEKTVTKVNLEAAKEISKQLRLRDISGIIIVDFIDMKKDENKQAVINELVKNSKKDRSRVQIEEFTKLNLMEITRKHINSKKS